MKEETLRMIFKKLSGFEIGCLLSDFSPIREIVNENEDLQYLLKEKRKIESIVETIMIGDWDTPEYTKMCETANTIVVEEYKDDVVADEMYCMVKDYLDGTNEYWDQEIIKQAVDKALKEIEKEND